MRSTPPLLNKPGIPIRAALHGLVALPLLAFALALAFDTWLQYRTSMQAAYQTAATIRAMSSKHTEELLAQSRATLEKLSRRSMVRSLDPSNCDPLISDIRLFEPSVANVYTINAGGNFVCSALPLPGGGLHSKLAQELIESTDQSRDFIIGSVGRGDIVDG